MRLAAAFAVAWAGACMAGVPAAAVESFERHGVTFTRVPWGVERPAPELTAEERKRGWVCFVPGELDGIGPHAFPTRGEIAATVSTFASAGQYQPVTFGVYATRPVKALTVQASRLLGPRGAILRAGSIDVRAVRIWPRRTDWNSTHYYLIPELLEKRVEADLPAGSLLQYWVTIAVPADTPPGLYEGYLRVAEGREVDLVPLRLRVAPFMLQSPAGKVWGLWSDTGRWRGRSDSEILDELADWRAHGMTCAIMYPLLHGSFALTDGKLVADLGEFGRFMDLYMRAGLGGPVVADLQGLAALVHRLLGQKPDDWGPEFKRLATEIARRIEDQRVAAKWPPFLYHPVDEPGGHPEVQAEAREMLRLLHEAGLKTFTTADVEFTGKVLSPYLDARCYWVGYCADSAAHAAARVAECKAAGAAYWWYGTGCYTGQEGNVAANRHLGGFLFDKSRADGAWAWTFQRPTGADDFEAQGRLEAKSACITFPALGAGQPSVPTLQWEGIRQGVDDARYLATLRSAIEDLRKAGGDKRKEADRIERELRAVLEAVPWMGQGWSSNQAQVIRWRLVLLTLDCAAVLGKEFEPVAIREPVPNATVAVTCASQPNGGSHPSGWERSDQTPVPFAAIPLLRSGPVIDGRLGEEWQGALKIEDLVAPDGSANRHRTEAWIARDRRNLYVAFRCHEDQMDRIRAQVKDPGGPVWTDDSVEVFVDAEGEGRGYHHFILNTLGVKYQASGRSSLRPPAAFKSADPQEQIKDPAPEDATWRCAWQGAAAPCPEGWSAEIALPLDALKAHHGAEVGAVMGLDLNRTRRVKGGVEYGCWSPTLTGFCVPARFGKLALTASPLRGHIIASGPVWGDNRVILRVDNPELVAQMDVQVTAGAASGNAGTGAAGSGATGAASSGTQRTVTYLLGTKPTEVDVPCDLWAPGMSELTVELTPRTQWVSREAAAAARGTGRRLPRSGAVALAGTRPLSAGALQLPLRRWVPPAMEVATRRLFLLEGWPGFDLDVALNLGRLLAQDSRLTVTVARGGKTVGQQVVRDLGGRELFLNLATGDLPPGDYRTELALEGPAGTLAKATVPFTVFAGP